jgi:hypothetical protein
MTQLDEYITEMAEHRAGQDVQFAVRDIGGLAAAIGELTMLRNAWKGIDPAFITQRQVILDLSIKLLRNKLRKITREVLIPALERWEKHYVEANHPSS